MSSFAQYPTKAYTTYMKFGDPKPSMTPTSSLESRSNAEMVESGPIHQFRFFLQDRIHKIIENTESGSDKKQFLIDQIKASRETWFKDRGDLLEEILSKIQTIDYDTNANFEENVVNEILRILISYITKAGVSFEEVGRRFRIMRIEQSGDIPLDTQGVVSCSKYDDVAEIHISKGLTMAILQEVIFKFLKILRDDVNIKNIKMTSWVVGKHKRLFEKFGFAPKEITDETELAEIRTNLVGEDMDENIDKPIWEIQMTREEFLANPRWNK